jgi:hypothetical protein
MKLFKLNKNSYINKNIKFINNLIFYISLYKLKYYFFNIKKLIFFINKYFLLIKLFIIYLLYIIIYIINYLYKLKYLYIN